MLLKSPLLLFVTSPLLQLVKNPIAGQKHASAAFSEVDFHGAIENTIDVIQ